MYTQISLSRTNPTSGVPFYFITFYNKDSIGFVIAQASVMISEAQYNSLKGSNEEKYQGEGNLYYVTLC
jgi:hypothetical protein